VPTESDKKLRYVRRRLQDLAHQLDSLLGDVSESAGESAPGEFDSTNSEWTKGMLMQREILAGATEAIDTALKGRADVAGKSGKCHA
jgi:hypothetical protein